MALPKEVFLEKMAEGRAKKKAEKEQTMEKVVPDTSPLPAPQQPESSNGNGHSLTTTPKFAVPLREGMENVYRTEGQQTNSAKPLIESGEVPLDLLMRTIIGGIGTDEYRLLVALNTELSKAEKVGSQKVINEVRNQLAMLPSLQGQSRNQYVSALIGQVDRDLAREQGKRGRLETFVRNGYGGNKEADTR